MINGILTLAHRKMKQLMNKFKYCYMYMSMPLTLSTYHSLQNTEQMLQHGYTFARVKDIMLSYKV